jgi:hypothetical protein
VCSISSDRKGDYVAKAEPILLVGEAGTEKNHLATGLRVAACRQRRFCCNVCGWVAGHLREGPVHLSSGDLK